MENVIHRLTLDLAQCGNAPYIAVRRGDSARTLLVSLAQNGRPYRISEGVTAVFSARKYDGVPLFNACTVQNNAVYYDFTGQTTNVAGPVSCEIQLYGGDKRLITSAKFSLLVEDTEHQEGDIPDSSPEYTALTELVAQGTKLIENLNGILEALEPLRSEVVQAVQDAQAAAEKAERAAADAERLAGHAYDATLRAEAAAEKAEAAAVRAENTGITEDHLQEQLAALKADILYEPIAITSISVTPSMAQIGAAIEDPTVSWAVSKTPAEQTVNGISVDAAARSKQVEGGYSAKAPGETQSVTVQVVDERGAVATRSATMTWHNAVYYTSHWSGEGLPGDAELIAMSQKLRTGRGLTINAEAGAGEYVLYACPARMGTPEFWANGFQGGIRWLGTVAHINAAGYREDYSVYVSNAAGLNGVAITVK